MKTKIQLENHTNYLSRDLKKLFTLVVNEYKRTRFNFKFNTVRVKCIYRRKKDSFCGGYAYYNNNLVVMKLPKVKSGYYQTETFEQNIARTFMHECDHCRGMKHGEMPDDKYRDVSFIPTDLIVKEKAEPKKVKKTIDDKVNALLVRKENWEAKLKRCENALKKINTKIKYYEKKQKA